MTLYQKELKKFLLLLGAGAVLLTAFMIYGHLSIKAFFFDFESIIVGIALILYPVGIAYGGRDIINMYRTIRRGDRIGQFDHIGWNTIMISAIWIGFAIALTFMFGWIFGTYKGIKKLISLKKECQQ